MREVFLNDKEKNRRKIKFDCTGVGYELFYVGGLLLVFFFRIKNNIIRI